MMKRKSDVCFAVQMSTIMYVEGYCTEMMKNNWLIRTWEEYDRLCQELRESLNNLRRDYEELQEPHDGRRAAKE